VQKRIMSLSAVLIMASVLNSCGKKATDSDEAAGSVVELNNSQAIAGLNLGSRQKYAPAVVKSLSAVGFLSDGSSNCTTFYIGNKTAITAGHCVPTSATDCSKMKVKWGLPSASGGTQKESSCVKILQYLNKSGWGDYAVFKINNAPEGVTAVSWQNNTVAKRGAPALIAGYVGKDRLKVTSNCNIRAAPIKWHEVIQLNVLALFRRNHDCTSFNGMSGALVFQLDGDVLRPVGVHHGPGSRDGLSNMTSISGHLGSSTKLQEDYYSESQVLSEMRKGGTKEECQLSYGDFLYVDKYKKGLSSPASRSNYKMLTDWFRQNEIHVPGITNTFHQEWLGKLGPAEKKICSELLSNGNENPFGNQECTADTNGNCIIDPIETL